MPKPCPVCGEDQHRTCLRPGCRIKHHGHAAWCHPALRTLVKAALALEPLVLPEPGEPIRFLRAVAQFRKEARR